MVGVGWCRYYNAHLMVEHSSTLYSEFWGFLAIEVEYRGGHDGHA